MKTTHFLSILVFLVVASAYAEPPFSFDTIDGHLPKTVVPRHYDVRLELDLPNRTFAGQVRTEITAREPVDQITMSANELTIHSAELVSESGNLELATAYDSTTQQLSLLLEETLPAGDYVIRLTYNGVINPNAEGFFYDRYTTPDGGTKEMFGTQCEVPDARRILPCWDEPAFKATFQSTLVIPEHFVATTNMPVLHEKLLGDGRKEVRFGKTPLMSTYLLAYFGGELEILEAIHNGVRLRILTTEGKSQNGAYALEVTKEVMDYFTDYFGLPYPLPQLDQVAVPNAFSGFGAMENWGCISYMETLLLYDPATSSQDTKEDVYSVVGHEVAHMWFGNIVTMGWWDNLWLNEAFASWMDSKVTDLKNSDWGIWLKSNRGKEYAMGLDARKATHPIQLTGVTEFGAIDAFDAIAYNKGQAFVRMLEDFLGEEPFREGIRLYMQRHQWSNTTTEDLWTALEDASGLPVREIAGGWVLQEGFPVITATVSDDQLHLSQERFSLDDPEATAHRWSVPISYAPINNLADRRLHLLEEDMISLPWSPDLGSPKVNLDNVGFYRVVYDTDTFDAIVAALPGLPPAEQINLLGDTWALVSAGRVSAADYLAIASALRGSTDAAVWSSLNTVLVEVDLWLRGTPHRDTYHRWVRDLMQDQYARLGWDPVPGESTTDAQLRTTVIYRLGRYGDPAVIAEASRRFERFLEDPATLDGNMRPVVLNLVGRYADEETYNLLWDFYQTALDTESKRSYLRGIQHATDPVLAERTRQLTLGEALPATHRNYNLYYVATSGEHLADTWEFAKEHAAELIAPLAEYGANSYLRYIVTSANDPRYADELETAQVAVRGESALPEARKTSGQIRLRAQISEREVPALVRWLESQPVAASPP